MGILVLVGFGALLGLDENDVLAGEKEDRNSFEVVGEGGGEDGTEFVDGHGSVRDVVVVGMENLDEDVEKGRGGGGVAGRETFDVVGGSRDGFGAGGAGSGGVLVDGVDFCCFRGVFWDGFCW